MASSRTSRIRIIGGKWRGRKVEVIDGEGLRPTPDRVRETLFNWLAPFCPGAMVLDCFAGSGALGLEAMSRGAGGLVLVEKQAAVLDCLRRLVAKLDTDAVDIVAGDALEAIAGFEQKFDIVFIDPPYNRPELRLQIWRQLEQSDLLRPGARIYFEWPRGENFELPSAELHWINRKSAGQVNYAIAEWRSAG